MIFFLIHFFQHITYKKCGWVNFGNWLGTEYLSEEEFKFFYINKFGYLVDAEKMRKAYICWWKENKPTNIPKYAANYYNK